MNEFGLARIFLCSPDVKVGNPRHNVDQIVGMLGECDDADVVAFPELAVTGYACGDLFRQRSLIDAAEKQIVRLRAAARPNQLLFVGCPVPLLGKLYNCALVLTQGRIIGIVPKQFLPGYNEFYEPRWFTAADGSEPYNIDFAGQNVPFGTDLLFAGIRDLNRPTGLIVAAEICEDGWVPVSPVSIASMFGATLGVNLSASPEKVATEEYRRDMVCRAISARGIMGYAYVSAGPSESTSGSVFSGHCLIAENGNVLKESGHVGDGKLYFGPQRVMADIDVERLVNDRMTQGTFFEAGRRMFRNLAYRHVEWLVKTDNIHRPKRHIPATPFVPTNPAVLSKRCASVFDIQCAAFYRRWKHIGFPLINLGVSGGLDSTHMLVVLHKMLTSQGYSPREYLYCKTMPGFGTTSQTLRIAKSLMRHLDVTWEEVDIRPLCIQTFRDLKHKPFGIDIEAMINEAKFAADKYGDGDGETLFMKRFMERLRSLPPENRKDLIFENVQAGIRTMLLFRSTGMVAGTGDMSELARGWCTFGVGDHMSHYNANGGVPKSMIKFLVTYVADSYYPAGPVRDALHECAGLTISPELLPTDAEGNIVQSTEQMVGPYTLNDFYMLNLVRYGFSPEKCLWLANHSELAKMFTPAERLDTLRSFVTAFFAQRFKPTTMPEGVKVGTLSLDARGDLRMPPDADPEAWLAGVKDLVVP